MAAPLPLPEAVASIVSEPGWCEVPASYGGKREWQHDIAGRDLYYVGVWWNDAWDPSIRVQQWRFAKRPYPELRDAADALYRRLVAAVGMGS